VFAREWKNGRKRPCGGKLGWGVFRAAPAGKSKGGGRKEPKLFSERGVVNKVIRGRCYGRKSLVRVVRGRTQLVWG